MAMKWGVPEPDKFYGKEIIEKVRMKVSDSLVNKFSDHEILVALNEGVDILWRALTRHFSTLTHKIVEYTLYGDGQLLPPDFYSLVRLECPGGVEPQNKRYDPIRGTWMQPHIEGTYLFGSGWVRMIYNYYPKDITLPDEIVEVPNSLIHDVVAIVSNIVSNNMGAAQSRAEETALRVSQNREIGPVPDMVAFP
jgi:hypothetical protein